jgi:signal peptidase I
VLTTCESPVVVVLSESMEPAFARGDLLFLTWGTPGALGARLVQPGDITVFKIKGRDIPIVHRAIEVHTRSNDSTQMILTKGDNNMVDDRGLYNQGQLWIQPEDMMGRVVGYIPYIGMVTIMLNDHPQLKVVMLVALAAMALLNRDDSG